MPGSRTADLAMEIFIALVNLVVVLSLAVYIYLLWNKDDNQDDN